MGDANIYADWSLRIQSASRRRSAPTVTALASLMYPRLNSLKSRIDNGSLINAHATGVIVPLLLCFFSRGDYRVRRKRHGAQLVFGIPELGLNDDP